MPVQNIPLVKKPNEIQLAENANSETLQCCLNAYEYQPIMTEILKEIEPAEVFDQARINEIVLWKVNRYAELAKDALEAVDAVKALVHGEHKTEIAKKAMGALLRAGGVDLPMASTILRFRNPEVFQIIDKRAYRTAMGDELVLSVKTKSVKPEPIRRYINNRLDIYETYLEKLIEIEGITGIAFKDMDRALYVYDKKINGALEKPTNDGSESSKE